ncbi:MAG TPA: enoyl-CoA hydratase/isomerase family protein [Acidimicrobiales bacterium]|nr:enoyl-CoA hydratase/isomerase family protein [Acidimicrobiales bacterium]
MSTVRLEVNGAVATVVLDRPETLNIYNLEMRDELIEAFGAVRDLPEVRAMVLAAEGRHFSAGADLGEFGSAASIFEARRIRWRRDPWSALLNSDKPSVAALHGYALGAGFEMALMCDFRLAAPDTVLGLPETRLGMLPSAGGSQTLTRTVGPARAARLVMTAENISAPEALATGLIHRVVEDVDAEALELARRLAGVDPAVMAAARLQLRRPLQPPGRGRSTTS